MEVFVAVEVIIFAVIHFVLRPKWNKLVLNHALNLMYKFSFDEASMTWTYEDGSTICYKNKFFFVNGKGESIAYDVANYIYKHYIPNFSNLRTFKLRRIVEDVNSSDN